MFSGLRYYTESMLLTVLLPIPMRGSGQGIQRSVHVRAACTDVWHVLCTRTNGLCVNLNE